MKAKIAKWGNSAAVRLPKAALEAAGLRAGAEVNVVVEGGELRLKQVVRTPHYTLEELVAEMDRLGSESRPALVDWGPDVGAEIIDDDYSRGLIPAAGGGSRVGRPKADAGTRAGRRPARRRTHRS
jgi:antitoxin MazE